MAAHARLFALLAAAAAALVVAKPSAASAAADLLVDFDLAHSNLFDGTDAPDFTLLHSASVDLPAPEPADYERVSEEERMALFERSVDGSAAHEAWVRRDGHQHLQRRAWGKAWKGYSKSVFGLRFSEQLPADGMSSLSAVGRAGWSGVSAMQCTLVDDDHIVVYDKAENNMLLAKNGKSAWGAVYEISSQTYRALNLETNSFCAGGGWIGNGTLVSVGGNPQQTYINNAAGNGLAAVRLFTPCSDNQCDVYEDPGRLRLTR